MMLNTLPPTPRANRRSAAGFTLVEILIALGIFLIGMTAIVSLFPAAAILQRETTQEVIGEMAAQSAKAIVNANQLTYAPGAGDLAGYYTATGYADTDAVPLPIAMGSTAFYARFPAADRSYPTSLLDGTIVKDCDLHWVPFIQDINGDPAGTQNWIMRIFLMEADSRAAYTQGGANDANPNDATTFPKVRAIGLTAVSGSTFTIGSATGLEPGDLVMDSNGNDHLITEISSDGLTITVLNSIPQTPKSPDKLWYAPRFGGTSSPAQRVVTVEVDVVAP